MMDMKCDNHMTLVSLCSWIKRQYPTGSRVIGGHNEDSDFDYVVTYNHAKAFLETIGLKLPEGDLEEYADSKRFFSFKYRTKDDAPWLNLIIVLDDHDMDAWLYATSLLQETPFELCENASRRKTMFGWALNDAYRLNGFDDRAQWPDCCKLSMPQ